MHVCNVKLNLKFVDQSCYQLVTKNHQTIEYSYEDEKKPVINVISTSDGYDGYYLFLFYIKQILI